jgi:tRNA 5-methylaminomethyl-2-thiouridine biosynthesis bifunctional protein
MTFQPIQPAQATFDANGILRSAQFDDVYASAHGALAQARHVFLGGNDLPARWQGASRFTIVETGFGAGMNFLATWQALRDEAPANMRLHFVSVEKHPLVRTDLARAHAVHPEVAGLSAALQARYPALLPGFHRLHFDGGRVTLTLLFGEALTMLRQLRARADAFYLDGFAPAKNPDLWSGEVFSEIARLANPDATFATYTVAAAVCQGLTQAGFALEKRPGFAAKRDMLCGRIANAKPTTPEPQDCSAAVIGAGLAGTSCAQRLTAKGWQVQLIERHAAPAMEASGNPAGLVRPVFSPDWNTHSRFTSAAFLYACRHESDSLAAGCGSLRGDGGVLQFARNAERFAKQQRLVESFGLPKDLVEILTQAQAQERAGVRVAGPASFFPDAFWANPASMCRANLAVLAGAVDCRYGQEVSALRRVGERWEVLAEGQQVLASAAVVVLANAHAAHRLSQAASLPLRPVRGQVSLMRGRPDRPLRIAVCGDGYVTPTIDGVHCFGASFNEDMLDTTIRAEDHLTNLRRLDSMLPGFAEGIAPETLGARVAFRAMSRDRLPVLGEIPVDGSAQSGLFACLALGSRGMTWAALAAEVVASSIAGDPMPVEANLLDALDAGRFAQGRGAGG